MSETDPIRERLVRLMASMRERTRGTTGVDEEISALRGGHRVEATEPPTMAVMVDGERHSLEYVETHTAGWQVPIHRDGDLVALVHIPYRGRVITSDMIEPR